MRVDVITTPYAVIIANIVHDDKPKDPPFWREFTRIFIGQTVGSKMTLILADSMTVLRLMLESQLEVLPQ
jgi:hypothetical protein